MAGNNGTAKIEAVQKLMGDAEVGVASDLVIQALDPIMERRLGVLLDSFEKCAPELGPLLDLRAKISEVWRVRKELKSVRDKGKSSWEALQIILEADAKASNSPK